MQDKFAENYDKIINKRDIEADCEEFVKFLTLGSIIDIGCGTGVHGAIFQEKYHFDVHGIEPNPILATQAENRLWGAVVNKHIESVKPQEAFYDNAVMLFQVFNFVDIPWLALKNTNALLKKGGRLVIEILDPEKKISKFGFSWNGKFTRFADVSKYGDYWFITYFMPFIWHIETLMFKLYNKEKMFNMLLDAGFSVLDVYDRGINKVYIAEKI